MDDLAEAQPRTPGTLVAIGGSEDRCADRKILRRFVDLCGGRSARIAVIGTATTVPDDVELDYKRAFADIVDGFDFLALGTREEANDDVTLERLRAADGIFVTGGNQLRLAAILGGSRADVLIHQLFVNGVVIAGTSAGAAVMSTTMIIGGSDTVPATDAVRLGPGFGLVSGLLIDMHFAERGRLARLLAAVAQFPHELGVGIDEDTALVINGSHCEVVGSGAATIVDAGSATSETTRGGAIGLTDVRLHVLPAGFTFDLSTRRPAILETGD
ncbi:MAG TPA: cyanophycinase [Acidimicrobiales bacterium]|nr:cyanophycinase [Acidimicrobiales bacterium]